MTKEEVKRVLSAYRPGGQDRSDPQFAEALEETRRDEELARWFAQEQDFDSAIAKHLDSLPAPFGLKTRILANATPATVTRWRWAPSLAAIAAALFLLAQIISVWRSFAGPHSGSLSDYQKEMMSFVELQPPLEMESLTIKPIEQWLVNRKAPLGEIPPGVAAVETMGCRILSFRSHPVSLICFCHGKTVAHLFLVDRAALPMLKPNAEPIFRQERDWTTVSWAGNHYAHMLAVHGDRAAAGHYLPHG